MAKDKEKEKEKTKVGSEQLEALLSAITSKYGKGTVKLLSDVPEINKEDILSSRSILLDQALGCGGIVRGRVVEIFGAESSGKTSLSLNFIRSAQELNGTCLFVDMEHALDRNWASKLGVDLAKLYISQPSNAEEALDIVEETVKSGEFALVVVDSVSALVPKAEVDGEMADNTIALQARLMSKALRKLVGPCSQTNTCVVFINQLRESMSIGYASNNEVTSGGKALKYYSSIRIELKKSNFIKHSNGVTNIGTMIKARIVKNKIASPYNVCEIPLIYGVGFSQLDELIDLLIESGDIAKAGAWYTINGQRGQGKSFISNYLASNTEEYKKFLSLAKENMLKENK